MHIYIPIDKKTHSHTTCFLNKQHKSPFILNTENLHCWYQYCLSLHQSKTPTAEYKVFHTCTLTNPVNKFCLSSPKLDTIFFLFAIDLHCCPESIKNTTVGHIFAQAAMWFFITINMGTVVYFEPTPYTSFWYHKYSLAHQVCSGK